MFSRSHLQYLVLKGCQDIVESLILLKSWLKDLERLCKCMQILFCLIHRYMMPMSLLPEQFPARPFQPHGYGGYGGYGFSLKSTCLRWTCPPTKFRFSGWRRCTAAAGQGGQGERSEPEYLIVPFAVRCDGLRPWAHIFLCLQSASFPSGLVAPVSVHHLRSAFWGARTHTFKDFIFRLKHQLGRRLRDLFSWPCDLQSDPPVNLIWVCLGLERRLLLFLSWMLWSSQCPFPNLSRKRRMKAGSHSLPILHQFMLLKAVHSLCLHLTFDLLLLLCILLPCLIDSVLPNCLVRSLSLSLDC